jgi:hypothetical protein
LRQYCNHENRRATKITKKNFVVQNFSSSSFFVFFVFSWLQYCSMAVTLAAPDAPTISHVAVDNLRPGEDFVVEATVDSTRPIARVVVAYQAGDRFVDVPLRPSGAGVYRERIAAARLGASIRYIIFATDDGGRTSTWPPPPANPSEPRGHLVTVSRDK